MCNWPSQRLESTLRLVSLEASRFSVSFQLSATPCCRNCHVPPFRCSWTVLLALVHAKAGTFNFDIPFSYSPKGKVTGSVGIRGIGSALVREQSHLIWDCCITTDEQSLCLAEGKVDWGWVLRLFGWTSRLGIVQPPCQGGHETTLSDSAFSAKMKHLPP